MNIPKDIQEIKAKVFALYINQIVYAHPDFGKQSNPGDLVRKLTVEKLLTNWVKRGHLQLRSVAMLTDEECNAIANFIGEFGVASREVKAMLKLWLTDKTVPISGCVWLEILDYLRSIGIALPVTLLINNQPQTIPVQQQVEWGIIKVVK